MRTSTRLLIDVAAVWLSALLVAGTMPAHAQEPDLGTRDMQDSSLFKSRPKSKRTGTPPRRPYRRTSAPKGPVAAPQASEAAGAEIGLTVWELRPSVAGDPRDIVHDAGGATGLLTPERLSGELVLSVGQHFRFAIESSREGFLYVVDRPVYEGGVARPPTLIFPTARIRGGANGMTGGQVVELPTPFDSPSYYTVESRGEGRLVAEELIVLVTPTPLDLVIGPSALVLSPETIAEWERRWGTAVERFDYADGDGMLYTAEEKSARHDPRYRLTDDGPAPQVLFRIPAKRDDPVFLRFTIAVGNTAAARW
jgi:hypothetical protein